MIGKVKLTRDGGYDPENPQPDLTLEPPRPARDGETLSDERRIDELLREFQMACEDAAEFNADSIRASAKHRAILRNELRSELLAVAALRAELADARADEERLDWLEKWLPEQPGHRRLVFDRSLPEFTLFQSDDNVRRLGMKEKLRDAIDAARSASGEDDRRDVSGAPTPGRR